MHCYGSIMRPSKVTRVHDAGTWVSLTPCGLAAQPRLRVSPGVRVATC